MTKKNVTRRSERCRLTTTSSLTEARERLWANAKRHSEAAAAEAEALGQSQDQSSSELGGEHNGPS